MKINKLLLLLALLSLGVASLFSDEGNEKKDELNNPKSKKAVEFKLEGKILKGRKAGYYLKTDMEEVQLPKIPADNTTLKYEDFVDKEVTVVATGHMRPDKKNPNFPDKHELKSVKEISLKEKPAETEKK